MPERAQFQNITQKLHINQIRPSPYEDLILEGTHQDEEFQNEKMNLSPRNAVDESFESFFICQICLKVILDPLEC